MESACRCKWADFLFRPWCSAIVVRTPPTSQGNFSVSREDCSWTAIVDVSPNHSKSRTNCCCKVCCLFNSFHSILFFFQKHSTCLLIEKLWELDIFWQSEIYKRDDYATDHGQIVTKSRYKLMQSLVTDQSEATILCKAVEPLPKKVGSRWLHVAYCACYYVFNRLETTTLEITHN